MTCDSDLYLPGTVRRDEGKLLLEREDRTIPIRDPDGLLGGTDDGERLTLGFEVAYDEAEATEAAVSVSTDGEDAILVGSRTS